MPCPLQTSEVLPDGQTYRALISVYRQLGQWQNALATFHRMLEEGVVPPVGAWGGGDALGTCLVCCRCVGRVTRGRGVPEHQRLCISGHGIAGPLAFRGSARGGALIPSARLCCVRFNTERATSVRFNTERATSVRVNTERATSVRVNTERATSVRVNTERATSVRVNTERATSVRVNTEIHFGRAAQAPLSPCPSPACHPLGRRTRAGVVRSPEVDPTAV